MVVSFYLACIENFSLQKNPSFDKRVIFLLRQMTIYLFLKNQYVVKLINQMTKNERAN